jgi:hypothetical protein
LTWGLGQQQREGNTMCGFTGCCGRCICVWRARTARRCRCVVLFRI